MVADVHIRGIARCVRGRTMLQVLGSRTGESKCPENTMQRRILLQKMEERPFLKDASGDPEAAGPGVAGGGVEMGEVGTACALSGVYDVWARLGRGARAPAAAPGERLPWATVACTAVVARAREVR